MFTVWMHGQQIGQTAFELHRSQRKRAGMFQPTAHGMTVLPGITAMTGALLDFGALCRERGFNTADELPEAAEAAFAAFADSPEGKRVQSAAEQIGQVEVRDPKGRVLEWESLMISDFDELPALAAKHFPRRPDETPSGEEVEDPPVPRRDPLRYMISLTLTPASRTSAVAADESTAPSLVC